MICIMLLYFQVYCYMFIQIHFKISIALDDLIKQHQKIPGSILRALLERFYDLDTVVNDSKMDPMKPRSK